MRYLLYCIFLCGLAFSATWAYRVNYETRDVARNLRVLQFKIVREEEKTVMLEGEWAYLNRPERLSRLSELFFSELGLMPISADNFAKIGAIKIVSEAERDRLINNQVADNLRVLPERGTQ